MTEARGKSAYLPTLDGWRAISILAVIFHHDSVHSLGPFSTRWLYVFGYSGVDVFFAISGILICSRLLDEERIDGSIYFGRFYIRRFFRILPPAILYLLVISSLAAFAIIPVSFGEVLESLFFCRNYPSILGWGQATQVGWYTGHFWSLAIEEQFYFIFPALIAFCSKRFRIAVLGSLALLIAVHRDIALNARPWELISRHPDVRLDSLVVPALFAVLASNPRIRVLLRGFLRFWPLLV